jgi:hypothetical protein
MNAEHNTGFHEQRRRKLEWLANYLLQVVPSQGINYGVVRAKLLNKWGLTTEKTEEYLQIVLEAYGFELREGKITKGKRTDVEG